MTVVASDHWISTQGGRLFARMWAPPTAARASDAAILLLHDSLGCVALWRDFPEHLAMATRLKVIAYDRLGFGRSDARSGALPLSFIRDEVANVRPICETLGLDAIILFGHSVGGGMAVAAATRCPELCRAVITESAQSFVELEVLSGVRAAKADFAQPWQFARLERYHGGKARWVLDAWTETWLSPAFADWRLDEDLRAVRCPVLALHGERDEYGSVEHADRIARLSGGDSRAAILSGCGHIPHREQPSRVLEEVSRFVGAISW